MVFFGLPGARADDAFAPKFELTTGLSLFGPRASLDIASTSYETDTEFLFAAQAGYFLGRHWEVSCSPSVEVQRTAVTSLFGGSRARATQLSLLAGPTYNFARRIQESFYIAAQAGISYLDEYGSASAFAYSVTVGKRFELFEHVSYNPSVALLHVGDLIASGSSEAAVSNWIISPFQFSILF